MLVNPVSVVILEWTLCYVMFCVILFGVCSPSVWHPVMSTRQTQPAQHAHHSHPCSLSLCRWTREAGPGRRGRSERSRTEGCMRRRRLPNSTGNLRGPSGTQTQQRTSSELLASPEDKPRIRPDELFKIQHSSKYNLICLQEYVALLKY